MATDRDRSITTRAIVLRRERLGEFHKSLSLLTSDLGLLSATAYGAYKTRSRLGPGTEPFTCSQILLYHNPVKRSYKVADIEINQSFQNLKGDYSRLAAASLWAEVCLKSYGAGEVSDRLFRLLLDSLCLLDSADARRQPYCTLQFLWRFLSLAGQQPGLKDCDRCGSSFGEGSVSYYVEQSNSLLCAACGARSGSAFPAGARRYLETSGSLPVEGATVLSVDAGGLRTLSKTLPRMVQALLESELVSSRFVGAGT